MAAVLDGRRLASDIEQRLSLVITEGLKTVARPPGLAVLRVGDDPASGVYVANKEKACDRIGIRNLGGHLSATTPPEEVRATIERLNGDPDVTASSSNSPFRLAWRKVPCWLPSILRRMPMGCTPSIWAGW
jgi:methylenetetrahydrofolate dehydrogenase (NADP+)/methenyltetrahydrofolate cyclohydrolase